MTSRQRVHRAIEMTGPDRVPIMHGTLPGAMARHGQKLEDLYRRYPEDLLNVGTATFGEFGPEIGTASRDPWGCLWVRHSDEHKGQVTHHPLADWAVLDHYQPPDLASDEIIDAVARRLAANRGEKYTVAETYTLWQRMYYLHGFNATVEDLLLEPERTAQLRDMVLEVLLRRLKRLGELPELDGIRFCEGWGTQRALLIRPRLWREFFKPAYAKMFDVVHQSGKHVWLHCYGMIEELIPDLIEVGVDVLNPQPGCMDRPQLRRLIARRICVLGDIDRQWTLPRGTPEEVRAAVRADIDTFASSAGGLIAHGKVSGEVPLENVEAMLDEVVRHGTAACRRQPNQGPG
jgi:uroporphyrinogen decarboxylase